MVVPPSFGSAIAVPAHETWYWMFTCAGSVQAPAEFVCDPSAKLLALIEVPLAVHVQWPVIDSTVPPEPIWLVAWFTSTVQMLRMQPRRVSSAQAPPSAASAA